MPGPLRREFRPELRCLAVFHELCARLGSAVADQPSGDPNEVWDCIET